MSSVRSGFSLVELMIVIAIIGILASLAIPTFIGMQLKSKRAEVPGNVEAIKRAELAYDSSYDGYLEVTVQPRADAMLDKELASWGTYTDWVSLGYQPDGEVRGNYVVVVTAGSPQTIVVTGRSDVDDDESLAEYTATQAANATLTPSAATYY